jgi:hypothetical protein
MTKIPVRIFAAEEEYDLIHIDAHLQGDRSAIYQEVSQRILYRLEQDFGQGVELYQDYDPCIFHISVDKVIR